MSNAIKNIINSITTFCNGMSIEQLESHVMTMKCQELGLQIISRNGDTYTVSNGSNEYQLTAAQL